MSYDLDNDFNDLELKSTWASLHPGVRSAVVMWAFLLVVAVINSFTAGSSLLFCYPVQLMLYVGNGYLAGRFALADGRRSSELARVGAVAGFVAWILPALYYLVFGFMLGFVSLGLGTLVSIGAWVLCGPIDLFIHAIFAVFGAWFAGRNNRDDVETYDW